MEARPRTLEIMMISGENLCIDRKPVRENAYVVVRAESLNCCTTRMAKESESSSSLLSWNEKFLLDMPTHARSVTFEVQCKTSKGAVRNVGVARIAITDFLGGNIVPESSLQVLSYRLRDWYGRQNGVIHFSVMRVKTPEEDLKPVPMKGMPVSFGGMKEEVMGFQVDEKSSNGVVTGIPVWWRYPRNI